MALASAQRSVGELDRCRESLLEATDCSIPSAVARRVELTALCAAVEHWQGHHDDAHRRLTRAWEELADHGTPEAAALQIELGLDGMYRLDFEQAIEVGRARSNCLARRRRRRPDRRPPQRLSPWPRRPAGRTSRVARAHLAEALEQIERLSDTELATPPRDAVLPGLGRELPRALRRRDRARGARGRDRARHRGGPAADPADAGARISVRDAGPPDGVHRDVRDRRRERAAVREPALPLVGAVRARLGPLLLGQPRDGDRGLRGERACRGRPPEGRDDAVRGRRSGLGARGRVAGDRRDRARLRADGELWGTISVTFPVERCFNWENIALGASHAGTAGGGRGLCARGGGAVRRDSTCSCPPRSRARTRAAVLLADGDAPAAAASRGRSRRPRLDTIGAGLQAGVLARHAQGQALAAAESGREAIEVLRQAERVFDACGSVRTRDEARRELRKLGARAEARGPAAAGDSGHRLALEARAGDRGADQGPAYQPGDRGEALPQPEDGRVAHPQHVHEAGCLVTGGGRAPRRTRAA